MTNKEILQSDMLDILFEHRNKAYGAYALRRGYDRRLAVALGVAMSMVLLFVMLRAFDTKQATPIALQQKSKDTITTYVIPEEKPRKPDQPQQVQKPREIPKVPEKVAKVKLSNPVIAPDEKVPVNEMPDKDDLKDKDISNENSEGKKTQDIVKPVLPATIPGNGKQEEGLKPPVEFQLFSSGPEFPGGPEALHRYFSRNLNTPDELNSGEKKTVRIRFWVGKDGSISALEIEQTGGDIFDREVIRVCKKMPRWKPAIQNGENVAVSYLLPVTFIGVEQ